MSAHDLVWYSASTGIPSMAAYPATAGQTFEVGEPVTVVAAGTLSECGDDPAQVEGIAAHRTTDVEGNDFGAGFLVTVYKGGTDQTFKTTNFATDGAGTAATPTLANIGDLAGLSLTGGVWSLDTGAANLICKVTGVMDVDGRPLSHPTLPAGAGAIVLFVFI